VTTNATLTYNGARTGLLTTEGLRDALEMRRGIREEQYNNRYENAQPVVPRYLRLPVKERLDYQGDVLVPLDEDSVAAALETFKEEGVQAVAICFMNSFANADHEERVARLVKKVMPGAFLSVSSEISPAIRFYDRISTTALSAYIGPVLKNYLTSLMRKLDGFNYKGVLLIMGSNGGVMSPESAMASPAVTLLSGPAGGPVAGVAFSQDQGYQDCITCDMGGTSFDVALVKDGKPLNTTEGEINRLRISTPMLDVVTIGSGGGSIGWIDEGGLLRMGPQSAGADPGPACYGKGGIRPACTDADLVLGYLNADFFAGGRIPLDLEAAKQAIKEHVAIPLGLETHEAAVGMYDVINVSMAAAVREIAVKNGYDPRDFPLVTAGGAGPNHACMIALELGIPVILVPRESSIFCAAGMLYSDLKHDLVCTHQTRLHQLDDATFRKLCEEMRQQGESMLREEGIESDRIEFHVTLDLRYVRQYHEVGVSISWEETMECDREKIAAKFHSQHDALFGYSLKDKGTHLELINIRLTAAGVTDKPSLLPQEFAGKDPSQARKGSRSVYLPNKRKYAEVEVYDGMKLRYGNQLKGPAIIEQVNTSTFVSPEFDVVVDRLGTYTLYLKEMENEILGRILQ
jgi:N-methylhydantoinase A